MKRRVFALLLVMTLVMGGCGKDAEDPVWTGENMEQTENTESEEPIVSVPERVYFKDIDVEAYLTLEGEYIGLSLTIPPMGEVTDEDVLVTALEPYNTYVTAETGITDRAAALGDIVNIDYSGKKDDVAFAGGTAQNQELGLGTGSFIPGFEDGLVGVMPGETVDLNLTFPESYDRNPDLAGAEVVFTVTVNFIYPSAKEEMLDSLVEEMTGGDYTTVDAFLEYAREYLEGEMEYYYTMDRENAVLEALEEIAVFSELPEEMVTYYEYSVRNSLDEYAWYYYGVDAATLYAFYGMDLAADVRETAENSTRQGMLFQYIAIKENLFLTEEEFEAALKEMAEENGYSSVEELVGDTDLEDFREYFLFERVVDFIVENGQVTEG